MTHHTIVSIDPDDAEPGVVYIEDALRGHREVEKAETRVYSIQPCYYLIPQIMTVMNFQLKYPIGHITAVCVEVGMGNFMRRFGEAVATIEEVRSDILARGGNWEDKEFAYNRMRADFHTSKMVNWGVRAGETVMEPCDRVAVNAGLSLNHMRQIAIMSGLVQCKTIRGADQKKMLRVLKWFGGLLEEKAGVAASLKISRWTRRNNLDSDDWVDDPWGGI